MDIRAVFGLTAAVAPRVPLRANGQLNYSQIRNGARCCSIRFCEGYQSKANIFTIVSSGLKCSFALGVRTNEVVG